MPRLQVKYSEIAMLILLLPSALIHQFVTACHASELSQPPAETSGAHPLDLDLASTSRTSATGGLLRNGPVVITVGGQSVQVDARTLLTPAERLAVYQVVSTQQQSIVLGTAGNAIGGTFAMGPRFDQFVSAVNIPQGVTATRDFGTTAALNLSGTLSNSGTLLAFSSNPLVSTASITAHNVFNASGALISSVSGASSSLNLNIFASNNIVNLGAISSSGNLSLTAGGSMINGFSAENIGAPRALMQAMGNLDLQAGNIVNNGVMSAINGSLSASTLAMNNAGILRSMVSNLAESTGTSMTGAMSMGTSDSVLQTTANLNIAANVLRNSGLLESSGSINIANLTESNLLIEGDLGQVNAQSFIRIEEQHHCARWHWRVFGNDFGCRWCRLRSKCGTNSVCGHRGWCYFRHP